MAILSNINDKFAVDSSGGIQFSGQTGTSGYVLKSNGNAAPTWVAPSAIIGGPYLPLTGGTLTGPLIGTSAAFSGNLSAIAGTFAGNATFSNRVTVNGYFQVNSTTRLGGAVTIEGDVFMDGYDITSINELSASTATFTGDITLGDDLNFTTNGFADISNTGTGAMRFKPSSQTLALTLTGANATFAGNVGIGSAPVGNPATKFLAVGTAGSVAGGIQLWATNAQTHYIQFGDAASGGNYYRGAIGYAHASDTLLLLQSGSTALSFTGSQEATFAGNVGIGKAPAKTLDVEGNIRAINTAGSAAAEIDISSGATWRLRSNPTSGTNSYGLDIIKGGAGTDVKMTINSDGNVGIGTATPSATTKLHIRNTTSNSYATLRLEGSNRGGILQMYQGAYPVSSIQTDQSGNTYFSTSGVFGSTTLSAKMAILTAGNVGIGETSPDQKLNVREDGGSDTFRGIEVHNNSIANARAGICFKAYDWVQSAIWHGRGTSAAYNGALVLGTNPNTSDLTVGGVTGRMWILNNGNVGIGATLPVTRLEVDSSQANSTIKTGGLEMQSYAVNNSWYAENLYYNNGWKLRSAGSATQMYMEAGVISFKRAAAGSAGASVSPLTTMVLNSNGNVGIGTGVGTNSKLMISDASNRDFSTAQFKIEGNGYTVAHYLDATAYFIVENSASRDIRIAANSNGVKLTPGATTWVSNSDISLKENLKPLDNVLDKIKDYRCVEYNLKNAPEDKKIGFIAQDWKNDFPAIIDEDKDGLLGMKYTETIPVLLKAIQELEARLKILENK